MDVVGVIPAAGVATRLSPIPCSKEILPIGIEQWGNNPSKRPKVAIQYLLDSMKLAGISKVYIIIRNNKWDIPAYLGDGKSFGMDIAYLMMGLPFGAPFSINQAYSFVHSSIVTLGYPDILFHPPDVYKILLEKLQNKNADVVLGLVPATNPRKMDMIEFDRNNAISRFVIKPNETKLRYTYINAVWTPTFSKFMHEYLRRVTQENDQFTKTELYVGDVFQAYLNDGNAIEYSIIEIGSYVDIGTVDDYSYIVSKYFDK